MKYHGKDSRSRPMSNVFLEKSLYEWTITRLSFRDIWWLDEQNLEGFSHSDYYITDPEISFGSI